MKNILIVTLISSCSNLLGMFLVRVSLLSYRGNEAVAVKCNLNVDYALCVYLHMTIKE